jgi:hypothetical protein
VSWRCRWFVTILPKSLQHFPGALPSIFNYLALNSAKAEVQIIRTLDGAVDPTHESADMPGQQGQGDRHDFDGETETLRMELRLALLPDVQPANEPNQHARRNREEHMQLEISSRGFAFKLQLPCQDAGCDGWDSCDRRRNHRVVRGSKQCEVRFPQRQQIERNGHKNQRDGKVDERDVLCMLGEKRRL